MTGLWRPSQQLDAEDLGFTGTFQLPSSSRHCHLPLGARGENEVLLHESLQVLSFMKKDLKVIYRLTENLNLLVYRPRIFVCREMGILMTRFAREPFPRNPDGVPSSPDSRGKLVIAL